MKRLCIYSFMIMLFVGVTGCSSQTNNQAASDSGVPVNSQISEQPLVTAEEPYTESPIITEEPLSSEDESSIAIREDNFIITTSYNMGNGYSVSYQTEIYPEWIRLTDTELLEAVWSSFGGVADPGDIATSLQIEKYGGEKTCVAMIEKRTVVNTSGEGWDFTADASANMQTPLVIDNPNWNNIIRLGAAFDYHGKTQINDGSSLITLTSNSWGPVPIIHIYAYVFTPEYPDGKPEIANTAFGIPGDDTRVTLDASW